MGFQIDIAAHRGATGCTDSPFVKKRNNGEVIGLENTIPGLIRGLQRAAYVETDLIPTRDQRIALTHSNDFSQHVLPQFRPANTNFICRMDLYEVLELPLGEDGMGRIPSFVGFLDNVRSYLDTLDDGDILINAELKDVQGTPCERIKFPSLSQMAWETAKDACFPAEAIRFSSFSLDSIAEMAKASGKTARLGMLFDIGPEKGGDVGKRLFASGGETYLGFTPSAIKNVLKRVPTLEALHPEIQTLTNETVELAASKGLRIATWGWLEQSPLKDREAREITLAALHLCQRHNVRLEIITDFIEPMRQFITHNGFREFLSKPRVAA